MSRLLLLLLITALFACKQQDDKLPDFPSELRLTGVRKKNGIRLFVNKTEIYNKAASMQFVDGLEIFRISQRNKQ